MAFDEPTLRAKEGTVSKFIEGYRAELIVPPDERMGEQSAIFLQPNIDDIIKDLNGLRERTDAHFSQLRDNMEHGEIPVNDALLERLKTYPVSCCLEITRYMLSLMSAFPAPENAKGLNALHNFVRAGGQVKRIWGGLRDTYFQNAIQAGTFYIDVANDTVDVSKPKVEIKLLSESEFSNLRDYNHYADIGEIYWKCRMVPNWFFPNIAPFFPILTQTSDGKLRFDSKNIFMFPKNIVSNFALAKEFFTRERHVDLVRNEFLPQLTMWMENIPAVDPSHGLYFTPEVNSRMLDDAFDTCAALEGAELETAVQAALDIGNPVGLP